MLRRVKNSVQAKLGRMWFAIMDDDQRGNLVFVCLDGILGLVSGFMTLVNIFTQKWLLMASTLAFFLACMVNLWLSRRGRMRLALKIFLVEALILCGFFCISGTPEGFSALWTCFIPSFTLTLLGKRRGSLYSTYGLLMIIWIFWTPLGRSLLQYDYTESFMLRFPMIYIAFFLVALFLETIRSETQRRLVEMEQKYQHLYAHDALTGIYNRYGFNEQLNRAFSDPSVKELGLLLMDLDYFKNVNDTYGHDVGDIVLKSVAEILQRMTGDAGTVCRWGGEEFAVLLWNGADSVPLAERIRREIETSEIDIGGRTIQVTVSFGVCVAGERSGITVGELFKITDGCLYQAKTAGRNRVCDTRL